jgi:hypothetical protein
VPGVVYWWVGCCWVEVPPSPKVQAHAVGSFAEVSVKATSRGAVPDAGDRVNDVVGVTGPGPGPSSGS